MDNPTLLSNCDRRVPRPSESSIHLNKFLQLYADHGPGWELQTYTGYFRLTDDDITLTRCVIDDDFIHWIGKKHGQWFYICIPLYEMKGYDSDICVALYSSFEQFDQKVDIECSENWNFEKILTIPFRK